MLFRSLSRNFDDVELTLVRENANKICFSAHLVVTLQIETASDSLMADINYYRQQSGYATEYGTFVGVSWILVFALYVTGMRTASGVLMTVGMLAFCMLPAVPFYFARRFKQQLPEETTIGYGRAYWFSLMMLVYASLLSAAAIYAYFKWMDHGALMQVLYNTIESPLAQQTYSDLGMTDTLKMMKEVLKDLSGVSPFDIAVALFNQNIMFSFILALPTALFARKQNKS